MKKILILIGSVLFFYSCNKKEDFNADFKKIILDYQKNYPIPSKDRIKERHPMGSNPIYIYAVSFSKENNDTIFQICRYSSGIDKKFNNLGIYEDAGLSPLIIVDKSSLSQGLVLNRLKNNSIEKFVRKEKGSYPEGFTPINTYLVKNKKIEFVKVDTVWLEWD